MGSKPSARLLLALWQSYPSPVLRYVPLMRRRKRRPLALFGKGENVVWPAGEPCLTVTIY